MNRKFAFTEQELLIIKENFNKKTLRQIMALMPRQFKYEFFGQRCRKLGYKRNISLIRLPKSSTYNQEYWKELSLNNCYLAGHLAADGCIMKNKYGYKMSVFAAAKDEIIIDNYIKELNYKGKKEKRNNHGFSSDIKNLPYCKITFSCFDENAKYLKQYFNLEPRKTERLGPTNLANKYLNFAFLIGLIDGDGSIFIKKAQWKNVQISCVSCSKPVIEWMRDILYKNFPKIGNRKVADLSFHKKNRTWSLGISGIRAAVIIDYLRKLPLENLRLKRKWDNPEVLAYIAEKKAQYPEYFIEPDAAELAALMPQKVKPEEYQMPPQISLPPL